MIRHPSFLLRSLPEALEPLADLALDLRWTWSHASDELWQTLDPELWELTRNPRVMLQSVSQARLEQCDADPQFMASLQHWMRAHQEYRRQPGWFRQTFPAHTLNPVAYFSMEFGLGEALPLYAGGLGILAGDHLKTASDLDVPVVGVGLLYQDGYFR
jgi:starch phosphorylase